MQNAECRMQNRWQACGVVGKPGNRDAGLPGQPTLLHPPFIPVLQLAWLHLVMS